MKLGYGARGEQGSRREDADCEDDDDNNGDGDVDDGADDDGDDNESGGDDNDDDDDDNDDEADTVRAFRSIRSSSIVATARRSCRRSGCITVSDRRSFNE